MIRRLVLSAVFILALGNAATASAAGTTVSSDVTTNTEWTVADSPYLVNGARTVAAGVTLTVDPGVTVQFAQYAGLTVNGTLKAVGTASAPISFVPSSAGQSNWWNGLKIAGTTSARNTGSVFSYVTIAGGGQNAGADLILDHAYAAVDHSTIKDSGTDGIRGLTGGSADVSDTSFTNNGPSYLNGGYAIWFHDPTLDPKLSGLSASGNRFDGVGLGDGYAYQTPITGTQEWEATGIPYVVAGSLVSATASQLVVDAGATVEFVQYTGLTLNGVLSANGTAAQPISFVSSNQQANWWNGLRIVGTSNARNTGSVLSYVTIAGGGQNAGADLILDQAQATVSHATIKDSGTEGIRGLGGAVADVSDTTFANDAGDAIWFHDPTFDPKLSNLTSTACGVNAVVIGDAYSYQSPMTGTYEWEAAGIPYRIAGALNSATGSQLLIDPGVTVDFAPSTSLTLNGRLTAEGSADQPILFDGINPGAGTWNGIWLVGQSGATNDGSSLRYVTITGAGAGGGGAADLALRFASAAIAHSTITNSSSDGVHILDGSTNTTIQASQIVGLSGYGVRNDVPSKVTVFAPSNWWGAADGPSSGTTALSCQASGSGSEISTGVVYQPFLTTADGAAQGPVVTQIKQVTVSPATWYAPSDGTTRDWLTITVRGGSGNPLANRRVHVTTDLGTAVDGAVTGPTGETNAYVTSATPGDAHVSVSYQADANEPCSFATTPSTTITFQPVDDGGGLVQVPPAPYASDDIIVPTPPERGTASSVGAHVRNPSTTNAVSVSVKVEFAQAGIGLVFGPVGTATAVIPPGQEADVALPWTPDVSGHYCFQVTVTATEQPSSNALSAQQQLRQFEWKGQRNVDIRPAPLGPQAEKNAIKKATFAGDLIEDGSFVQGALMSPEGISGGLVQGTMLDNILSFIHEVGGGISCALGGGTSCGGWTGPHFGIGTGLPGGSLLDDPPRSDYQVIATLDKVAYPTVSVGDGIPAARAQALNDLTAASVDTMVKLRAAALSFDRYGGAAAARNLAWASQQSAAYLHYKKQAGAAMIVTANKLDALEQELKAEGFTDLVVSPDALRAYQDRLRTQGFSSDEVQAARNLGYTDDVIEGIRQNILAEDPTQKAGGQFARWTAYAAALRSLGQTILAPPPTFTISVSGSPGAALRAQATADNLVQSYASTSTIQLGNPLAQTATIAVKARPIDLPADWMVSVSPASVTLAPGEQTTVTVTVTPGLSQVQGTQPRVAVEGYAGGQLLGGVVEGVVLPQYASFDGKFHAWVPFLARDSSGGW